MNTKKLGQLNAEALNRATAHKPLKIAQALYAPFSVEIFDSRNTSYEAPETFSNERDARLFTKFKSVPFKAILWDYKGHWVEYENGVVTSWSVEQD